MSLFSKKTKFENLSPAQREEFILNVAELYLDSFDRWGRFPPGPESIASIKLGARNYGYKVSLVQCGEIHEAALIGAREMARSRRT
ncbi:MAG: hypothetical protein CME06_01145 [Gemmatimonadetes bacterium]|jgi:hypothetical protein|nr:hypothetical protein [Gemmatimonadota bacterium]